MTRGRPWAKGQSGNPAGRPAGSRNRLGEKFIDALAADFEAHGAQVIVKVREECPSAYLRIVAGLLPNETDIALSAPDQITKVTWHVVEPSTDGDPA